MLFRVCRSFVPNVYLTECEPHGHNLSGCGEGSIFCEFDNALNPQKKLPVIIVAGSFFSLLYIYAIGPD